MYMNNIYGLDEFRNFFDYSFFFFQIYSELFFASSIATAIFTWLFSADERVTHNATPVQKSFFERITRKIFWKKFYFCKRWKKFVLKIFWEILWHSILVDEKSQNPIFVNIWMLNFRSLNNFLFLLKGSFLLSSRWKRTIPIYNTENCNTIELIFIRKK